MGPLLALAGVVAALGVTNLSPVAAASFTSSVGGAPSTAVAKAPPRTSEQQLAALVNAERTKRGLKAYSVSTTLSAVAERQARAMASQQRLFHNPTLTTDVTSWQALGENVGYASSVSQVHTLLMNSPPHKANVLSKTFTQIGLGVVKDSKGRVWVVQVFRKPA